VLAPRYDGQANETEEMGKKRTETDSHF